jgi:hypothetical protein
LLHISLVRLILIFKLLIGLIPILLAILQPVLEGFWLMESVFLFESRFPLNFFPHI